MTLIDAGAGNDLEFGHTDYVIGEGRFVTHSENQRERYIDPDLSYAERKRISGCDTNMRNRTQINLWYENNVRIREYVQYNHATEDLPLSWSVNGDNKKKLLDISSSLDKSVRA